MRVLGIDLAAEAKSTGVVVLEVDPGGRSTLVPLPDTATDDVLVAMAREVDLVAVDSPLGWPVDFLAALIAHGELAGWPAGPDRRSLRHRRTDLVVQRTTGLWPLSVSSDKLGVTAMRCAHLQHRWATEVWGEPAPRDGSGRLVEGYPAASLKASGRPFRGYKGPDGHAVRREIVSALSSDGVDVGAVADLAVASDHVLDAALAALTGAEALQGRTVRPTGDDIAFARTEGWIHLPAQVGLGPARQPG